MPDVAILRRDQIRRMPSTGLGDVIVAIEVSDTSYRTDRGYKMPLYVRAGLTAYIVDTNRRHVEEYRSEADLQLASGMVYPCGNVVTIAGVEIEVSALFLESDV